ncbi:MAG: sulfotransferase [Desulfobacula sp.]|nr:sulfotransferase [Desulfobacula sp.]
MITIEQFFSTLRGIVHYPWNYDKNNTIILSGVARGGTTWIAEIINTNNNYRYNFEPLHTNYVPLFEDFILNQYISPESNNSYYIEKIERLLSGRMHNLWTDRFNKKIFYDRMLIKEVRMNLMLSFIRKIFPEVKIVLLLRHPFAVANSRINLGWNGYIKSFCDQTKLVKEHLESNIPNIQTCVSDFEKQICMWCVQNSIPLSQLRFDKNTYICFYEHFCINTYKETKKLFEWLNMESSNLDKKNLNRLSKLAKKNSSDTMLFLEAWKKRFSSREISRGLEILSWFGIEEIYGREPIPIIKEV